MARDYISRGSPLIRAIGVALLALVAAVVVTFGVIQIRTWWSGNSFGNQAEVPPSDEEKLRILASLEATSTLSVEERSLVLEGISTLTQQPSEEEKFKVLESLQDKK